MKTRYHKIVLAVAFGLALALTFSCSSDDGNDGGGGSSSGGGIPNGSSSSGGGGGGSNISDLPSQAYIVNENELVKYNGTSNITLRIPYYTSKSCYNNSYCICTDYNGVEYECEKDDNQYESKTVGKIQNGQVSLNLPDIESKYLWDWVKNNLCSLEEYGHECNISYPENFTGFTTRFFYVTVSNKSCELVPFLAKSGVYYSRSRVYLDYFSQSGKITGTHCFDGYDAYCYEYDNYDYSFSEGWNIRYRYPINDDNDNQTADLSKTGGELQWGIDCNEW